MGIHVSTRMRTKVVALRRFILNGDIMPIAKRQVLPESQGWGWGGGIRIEL